MPQQPNILLIVSDEHAPQTVGCYGAAFARTPNMDRLARGGVTFDSAYCNFALCVPSRNSFMTGLLPHRIGAYDNGSAFSSHLPTWAHMLRRAGYHTALSGKMHFVGPDTLHGFHEHWYEHDDKDGEARHPVSGCRWGEENPSGTAYRCWTELTRLRDAAEHPFSMKELKRLHASLQYIRSRPADGRPWALCVGFSYPHYPQVFTEAAWNRYEGVAIPEPVRRESFHPRVTKWSDDVWGFNRVPPDAVADMRRAYLAMVTMLDDWIGLLMKTLEETGQAENTVVVYTSDHGDMWGEHDLWGKNLFYEESSRVPLIVSAPSLGVEENRHIPTPVSLVDLYPTLRDAAGVTDWPAELDGRSLWGACRGEETLAEEPVFCDYYASDTKGPERMVRLGRYKLNYYHHWGMELFDLEADPREQTDLADHPDYADIRRQLLDAATADWNPDAVEADIRREQNRKQLVGESMGHRA